MRDLVDYLATLNFSIFFQSTDSSLLIIALYCTVLYCSDKLAHQSLEANETPYDHTSSQTHTYL